MQSGKKSIELDAALKISAVKEYFLHSSKYNKANISENAHSLFNASIQAKAYIEVYKELLK